MENTNLPERYLSEALQSLPGIAHHTAPLRGVEAEGTVTLTYAQTHFDISGCYYAAFGRAISRQMVLAAWRS